MAKYSETIVRCNYCMQTFPREPGIKYSSSFESIKNPIECPRCHKGHLWLFDIEVDEKRLKRDKYNREHPSHSERVKNAIHLHGREYTKPEPPYGSKLDDGFWLLSDDKE